MNNDTRVTSFPACSWMSPLSLLGGLLDLVLGDHPQIVGNHAPADPALHPIITLVATTVKPMPPFQLADASFDARPPVPTAQEPALPLVRQLCRRFAPFSWQDDPCDASLLGSSFIGGCRQFAVAGDQA